MKTGRLRGLDALRGIAALVVLIYHTVSIFELTWLYEFHAIQRGYLAVDFFFMLSGYVIARMLDHKQRHPVLFVWSRYKRFLPTMAAGTSIGFCAYWLHPNPTFDPWIAAVTGFALVPIFTTYQVFPLNSPTWSIFFELFANTIHSIMPRKAWPAVFVIALAAVWVTDGFASGPSPANFLGGFARVLVSYSLGVMLFGIWRDNPSVPVPPSVGWALLIVLMPVTGAAFDYFFVLLICPLVLASGLGRPRAGRNGQEPCLSRSMPFTIRFCYWLCGSDCRPFWGSLRALRLRLLWL